MAQIVHTARPFSVHDILQEEKSKAESLPYLCRYVVTEFLRRTGIDMPSFDATTFGAEADELARAEVQTWNVGNVSRRRLDHHVVTSINLVKTAYKHTPIETQVHIALWTALCICVDDFEIDTAAVAEFAERFHGGREQLHPLLDLLAEKCRRMPEFFHSYGAASIVTNTVQYVACTLFDKEAETMEVHPAAREYPLYKRARNGIGEGYAYCIWDKVQFPDVTTHIQMIPEAISYLIYVNDLLSFYKEELVGEKKNFVHDRARVMGKDLETALMDTMEDVIDCVNRGREVLQGEKEKQAWESFLIGYVAFHFISPRYRLEELFKASD